ncbi:MAG: trypsin-like peptidase domain-containing protein [Gammaproteobacteria bacterium]|nr:trypsin-like peptidase domain-containing protein [Gammaproteobacteria bacterium]
MHYRQIKKNGTIRYLLLWTLIGIVVGLAVLFIQGKIEITDFEFDDISLLSKVQQPKSFSAAVRKAAPAVVTLNVQSLIEVPIQQEARQQLEQIFGKHLPDLMETKLHRSSGSGVILDTRGYVITNHHVIAKAKKVFVNLNDGRSAEATLVGTDPDTDLAVLKIELDNLPKIKMANMKNLNIGDVVLAIGFPFRIGQTVTQGIISATGRNQVSQNTYENFIQTDAAINPGNSGGALVNSKGEIIGINSLIYTETGNFAGIGFAIPIDLVNDVMTQITENGYVIRGWLGVEGQNVPLQLLESINLEIQGVLITGIDEDGPGDKAGLQVGDIITHINQKEIHDTADVLDLIAAGRPGDNFRIDGLRERQSFSVDAVLGQRPMRSQ